MLLAVLLLWMITVFASITVTNVSSAKTAGAVRHGVKRFARMDGDIILGALFPIHREPKVSSSYTRQCGPIWEQYGMHRFEVFLRTVDQINRDPTILPNVTLGYDVRDSCWYAPVALEQSIDFIKNSIASLEGQLQQRNAAESSQATNGAGGGAQKAKADECGATGRTQHDKPIAGLIGPGSSTVTVQVQNVLSLFNIPQIGYSATSIQLSDVSSYRYFLRVVPSDVLQAQAMVDLVVRMNWTYVSTVNTYGSYGAVGIEEFRRLAKKRGVCEAGRFEVPEAAKATDDNYTQAIDHLRKAPLSRVVVCFCEGQTITGLLKATRRKGVAGQFLFLGSESWADRPDVVQEVQEEASGGISVKLLSPPIADFDDYYLKLKPDNNSRNPWFSEFWQEKFSCYIEGPDRDIRYDKPCTGKEDLSKDHVQDAKLGFVVNAVYTMAYALHAMHTTLCHGEPGLCAAMNPVNGTVFLNYLLNVTFKTYSADVLQFDDKGDPPGRYEFMNYQKKRYPNGTIQYGYTQIGTWDNGNLTLNTSLIFWPNPGSWLNGTSIESVCSKPCPRGQIKNIQNVETPCCWLCTPCKEDEYLLDEFTCKSCPDGWRPSEELTECLMIPISYITWLDTEAIAAVTLACIGIASTLFVAAVFLRHHDTPVVKASTRELSYIILIGICMCYVTTFFFITKPTTWTCYLTRVMPGLSFSLIYGALVTKTNRIARILSGRKKIMTSKPRFMSASAQVVITGILIGIECVVIIAMLVFEPGKTFVAYPNRRIGHLACALSTEALVVPLIFDIILVALCTVYAVRTRNLPENFNEAKFIGFSMYTTCVIWVAFIPIYFGSEHKLITMCMSVSLSASVALVLLFMPKIYIILFRPERNSRSSFTTSKEVRCHIGSSAARASTAGSSSTEGAADRSAPRR